MKISVDVFLKEAICIYLLVTISISEKINQDISSRISANNEQDALDKKEYSTTV